MKLEFTRFCSALCSNAAASSSVHTSCSPSPRGRIKGVRVRKSQMPCRSGSPHAVRGGVQFVSEVVCAWPASAMDASDNTPITIASTPTDEVAERRSRTDINDLLPEPCDERTLGNGEGLTVVGGVSQIKPSEASSVWPVPARNAQCTVIPQHFLYFFPLPHGQGSLRPILSARTGSEASSSYSSARAS